jgi:flagellin
MLKSNRGLTASMQRLSSGFRINSAREDAAGLAIANKLSYQLVGLNRASDNASHGVAMINTAEGALNEVHNILQRMRELAVQAANGTLTAGDREIIQIEINELTDEIQAISERTEYNKMKLIGGEGARITESRWITAMPDTFVLDRTVSKMLHISDAVQPGSLRYNIIEVGLPAIVQGGTAATGLVTTAGTFNINGIDITASLGEPISDVQARIQEACLLAGIDHWTVGTQVNLATTVAGSGQWITITESVPGVLAQFGLTAVTNVRGSDAVIDGIFLNDHSGANISSFNGGISNGLGVRTSGNQVTVVGIGGERIMFNIQVALNKTGNNFTYGDGTTVVYDVAAGPVGTHIPIAMEFEFKNYGPIIAQIGPSYNNNVSMHIPKLNAETLGFIDIVGGVPRRLLNYVREGGASSAISMIDTAIDMVSATRSQLGAFANRLEATVRSLDIAIENTESSRSRILDTDMAREMTRYSQLNVMYQAGLAILGQSNMRPQQILSLLQ